MSDRKTVLSIIILVLVLAGITWFVIGQNKKSEIVSVTPILSVSASRLSARPQDTVVFTLIAENQTNQPIEGFIIEANISEVTDKSTLVDAQGASYNSATNSLVWTPLDIPANQSIQKSFTVRVNPLSTAATNTIMRIKFNNELQVAIEKPQPQPEVAGAASEFKAPLTGTNENFIVILSTLFTFGVFLAKKWKTGLA